MQSWSLLWGALLLVSLGAFAVLVIRVAVGGWLDLRRMLRRPASEGSGDAKGPRG